MARILFRRAARGHRAVRGEPIRQLQAALAGKGHSVGKIDGIYGGDTELALKLWQRDQDEPETGAITDDGWQVLTGGPAPDISARALQITGDFEGHGFGKAAGNFDNAWLTWSIIGFTLKHGEIGRIVDEADAQDRALVDKAFGAHAAELRAAVHGTAAQKEAFGDAISIGAEKYKLAPEWAEAFAQFGARAEVQALQLRRVAKYWDRAKADARRFDLTSDLGLSLCFDIAVQNGGIDRDVEENSIRRRIAQTAPADEAGRRLIIADVVAENSIPRYVGDVRARKRTIAQGSGIVHGASYDLADWGLTDSASA